MMKTNASSTQDSAEQEAVRWVLRLQNDQLSDADQKVLTEWRSVQSNEAALAKAHLLWRSVEGVSERPEIVQLRKRVSAATNRRRFYVVGSIAASIVLLVAVGISVVRIDYSPEKNANTILTTMIGERSTVTLPDGSIVILDTDSAADVAFSEKERGITLRQGQALFQVAKNKKAPFVVYAGNRRIVATGTAFDVRLEKATLAVTMVEGQVVVDRLHPQSTETAFQQSTELTAGQQLKASGDADSVLSAADVDLVTSWTTGKLVFRNTKLVDAIAEANRYTRTPILLDDDGLANLAVNGVFRTGQPVEFARALSRIYPVSVNYGDDGKIRITSK